MKLLQTLKERALFGAATFLATAPALAYDPSDKSGSQDTADAFAGIANILIGVLQGSGGFVMIVLSIIGAGIGMLTGKTILMWICIGLIVLLSAGVGAAKILFGATF